MQRNVGGISVRVLKNRENAIVDSDAIRFFGGIVQFRLNRRAL